MASRQYMQPSLFPDIAPVPHRNDANHSKDPEINLWPQTRINDSVVPEINERGGPEINDYTCSEIYPEIPLPKKPYSCTTKQIEILQAITSIYLGGNPFHLDACYNKGGFYRNGGIAQPVYKNDLHVKGPGITNLDIRVAAIDDLVIPLERADRLQAVPGYGGSLGFTSIIFDPPFLIGNNIMTARYGGFSSAEGLFWFQIDCLTNLASLLIPGGILVTKIQDFTHGGQKYFPSIFQVNEAKLHGLHLIDSFVFARKHNYRAKGKGFKSSISAHTFFHVFHKQQREKRINRY